jgi:hypothetical protein
MTYVYLTVKTMYMQHTHCGALIDMYFQLVVLVTLILRYKPRYSQSNISKVFLETSLLACLLQVVVSAPVKDPEPVLNIVYGVNHVGVTDSCCCSHTPSVLLETGLLTCAIPCCSLPISPPHVS